MHAFLGRVGCLVLLDYFFFKSNLRNGEMFKPVKVCRAINKQHRALLQYRSTTFKEFWFTTEEMKSLASPHYTSYEESYCGGRSQTIIRLAISQREENAWERFTFHSAISWVAKIVGVWRVKWQEHCKHLNREGMLVGGFLVLVIFEENS